jgi:hypothetical protein
MYHSYWHNNTFEELGVLKPAIGFGSTTARNTAGAGVQYFNVDVGQFLSLFSQPLPYGLFDDDLEFRCYFQTPSQLVQTDYTTGTFTYTNFFFVAEYTNASEELNKYMWNLMKSGNLAFTHFDWLETTQDVAASASLTQQVSLPILADKDIADIAICIKKISDLSTNYAYMYDNFQATIQQFNLKSAGVYINGTEFDVTPTFYQQEQLPAKLIIGQYNIINDGVNIYNIVYADNLEDMFMQRQNQFSGAKNFRGINDSNLNIIFTSTTNAQRIFIETLYVRRLYLMPTASGKGDLMFSQ